jgi:PKD repeat protein
MSYARRGVPAFLVFLTAVLAFPSFAATLRPKAASRGMIVASKSVHAEAAGIFFSGSFSYSIGGGNAVLKADNVTNPNGTATGPLRFALWWTPTPYPSAGNIVATYDITPSLAANSSISPVNGGNTPSPFTTPPTGCYSIALVLEENVSGTWTERDYGNFSLKFDIGGGCITSFTASPTTVTSGSPSTLSWTTGGGSVTSVSIDNGVGSKPANGSATVNPVATTTYTLSAFTTANSTPPSKQVTVTVSGSPAPTATFSASPTSITAGQSSTLTWTSSNATSVSIDNGVGSQAVNGSVGVSPASTTTYTLTATGPGGTITKTATVTVTQPAPTASFSAAPTSINAGQSSTLTWSTTNATSISIDNGVGSKPASGTASVSPASTTTYTLTATGPGGTITRTATVTVIQPAPTITFSATPSNISAGQSSTLVWNTTNATSVTIDNGVGSKPVSGSATVSPSATTTYTLTATGPGGTLTSQATVTVSNRPSITFGASPATIIIGSSSTLTWQVTNSTSVTIDNGLGAQGPSGSMSVTPGLSTTYTLTATGPGGTSTASAVVTVVDLPRINFSVTPSVITAGGSATLSWAVTSVDFVTIDQGVGTVFAIGTRSVSPTQTTVYKLTATNIVGTVTATATVTVGTPPPPKHRAVRH